MAIKLGKFNMAFSSTGGIAYLLYIQSHTRTCTHTHTHTHMYPRMHTHAHAHMYTQIHTEIACTETHVPTHAHMRTHTDTHTHRHRGDCSMVLAMMPCILCFIFLSNPYMLRAGLPPD